MGLAVCKRPCCWGRCGPCCHGAPGEEGSGSGTAGTHRANRFKSVYSYMPRTSQDLCLQKGEVFEVLHDHGQWLFVQQGERTGYVPRAFAASEDSLEAKDWYFGKLSRLDAKRFLLQPMNADGAFLVWWNEEVDCYYLSVRIRNLARHYQIQASSNTFYLVQRKKFPSLEKLLKHYYNNADGLCTKLELPCAKLDAPSLPSLSHNTIGDLEIQPRSFEKIKELGSGAFGTVWLAKWNGTTEVAIKELQVSAESMKNKMQDEAETMWNLNHERVLKLYAVCLNADPVFIVTEYMRNGSLRRYLKARAHAGGSKNTQHDGTTEDKDQQGSCRIAEGDSVLLRNFNRKWHEPPFTGPHLVEKVAPRAVKLADKNTGTHLHDIKPYIYKTRPRTDNRATVETTSPAAPSQNDNTSTTKQDNTDCAPDLSPATDPLMEIDKSPLSHPMVTRSQTKLKLSQLLPPAPCPSTVD